MRRSVRDGSIIIISHQERILNVADEIVVIGGGRVERKGSKEEILPTLLGSASVSNFCTGAGNKEGV